MREIKFREEITYRIDDYLITTNTVMLRPDSKGWYKENGYIMRKVNNHPRQNKRGYVAEHRLVYEKHLGRFLDTKEVIHHINGDREDNRIENLQIAVENSEHIKKYHKKSRNENGQFICENPIFNDIKFRLFDKDRKITVIYTLKKLIATTFRRSKFDFRGRFTGLKDKNGKEIYEGDVILTQPLRDKPFSQKAKSKRLKGIVKYNVKCGKNFIGEPDKIKYWGAEWDIEIIDKKDYEKYHNFGWGLFFECEVIGNIYDNPELLEEK